MLTKDELAKHVWVGVVEEVDERKRGRVRARVRYIHGDLPTKHIAWAQPAMNSSGTEYVCPGIGKVVNIQYLDGDLNSAVYTGALHYDINLQTKLESMSDEEYLHFVSVHYDHATQIYREKGRGLVLDNEYSNIQIDDRGNIFHNLRDNKAVLALGTADADQSVVLGDNFMSWLSKFLDCLLQGGFIGNLGAPTVANPQLIQLITEFKASKDPKFLSKHVFAVDNMKVQAQKRMYKVQPADEYAQNDKIAEIPQYEPPYEPEEMPFVEEDYPTSEELDMQAAAEPEAEEEIVEIEVEEEKEDGTTEVVTKKVTKNAALTEELLAKYMPQSSRAKRHLFAEPIAKAMKRYGITTPLRQAHFLAQLAHESQSLLYTEEIASGRRYEGRSDLGNTQPGDGVKFKGRGLIQLTGRSNYKAYGRFIKKDLLSNPEIVANDPYYAADVAGWFWMGRHLNKYADANNVYEVTRRINGGQNGISDRIGHLNRIKRVQQGQA